MAVSNYSGLTITQPIRGIQFTKVTDTSADWSSVANDTYFYDKGDKLIHYKDTVGNILDIFSLGLNSPGAVYGLFAQTANSTPITNTTTETTLLNGGIGTLSVPANGFKVGDSFRADLGGEVSTNNNHTIQIKVKAGSVILADSGIQTLPTITNDVWSLSVNFTIRALGGAGVGSIVTLGNFLNIKSSNGVSEGFSFNTVNSTTFNTTISNTLDITAQWGQTNASDNIFTDIFVLNKIF
jgi:hypothetical protein